MSRALFFFCLTFSILLSNDSLHGEPSKPIIPEKKVKPENKGLILFEKKIKPVLEKHCYKCHSKTSGNDIEGGLELDSPSGMKRGGDSGPILTSHKVAQSPLIPMLRHAEDVPAMPPKKKLSAEVIADFEEWIRLGAADSRKENGMTVKEQRIKLGQSHWSFQPPLSVKPPSVKQTNWPRSDIDKFVLSQMESKELIPVADANHRTLIRRIYFDLIGLPPSPQQVDAFLADKSSDALEKLIDRLLSSPRFGERWGRHWLDVVRYAESSGMEFNFTYPHAWPYRNYVIDSFNQDKPYDVFLREQIAGDLIPTKKEESPSVVQTRRIATSVLAFGPKRHNSSGTAFRMDVVDDQINTICRATLSLTVACARCHDHKFDPIPTKEYYALAGIFLSTEPLYGTIKQKYSNTPTDLIPIGPGAIAKHAAAEKHLKLLQGLEKSLANNQSELKKATAAEKKATAEKLKVDKKVKIASSQQPVSTKKPPSKNAPKIAAKKDLTKAIAAAKAKVTELKKKIATLTKDIAKQKKSKPPRPQYAMSTRDRAKPADTKVAIRGDYRQRGQLVKRGFLSAVSIEKPPKINSTRSGRLEFAQWITHPKNPLTARVMTNRIWHHLFGRGLVESVDNFGLIGTRPSHPELLDSLAIDFMKHHWSVKKMIRTIMLSRTYQLSCTPDPKNLKIDPGNRLLWRATPRRLEAEAIRDAILTVSGQLNLKRPVGSSVTALGDKLVRGIPLSKLQPPSNYRSVYLPVVRDYLPEIFDLFDFPSPSLVSGRRSVTNVPTQALYLRNSPFVTQQAKHAAARLLSMKHLKSDAARVDLAMRWTLARDGKDHEKADALKMIQQIKKTETKSKDPSFTAWAALFHSLFTTAEFRYLVDIK